MNKLLIALLAVGLFGKFCYCVRLWNAEDQRIVLEAYKNATKAQALVEAHERQLFDLGIVLEPEDIGQSNLGNFHQFLDESVKEAFRTSRVLRKASQYLHRSFYRNVTKEDLCLKDFYMWLYDMSRYIPSITDTPRWKVHCDPQVPYRAIDGVCNNLNYPNAGRAVTTFARITLPTYDHDIDIVRKGSDYRSLPLVRNLVVYFFLNTSIYDTYAEQLNYERMPNMAALMFSQVVAHDITQKLITQNPYSDTGIQCCARRNSRVLPEDELNSACIPIEISPRDPVYQRYSVGCIDVIRSETISPYGKTLSAAQQMNRATAIPDLSVVYGSTKVDSDNLRTFSGGRLQTSSDDILPETPNCTSNACYRSGDSRANQTPFLAIWYSLFFRHHNRVARILATLNSHWDDEKLFQETRRILIAQYQHILYNEYLPAFFGNGVISSLDTPYSAHIQPTTANEFAGSAFRVFHLFLPNRFVFADARDNIETILLSDTVFNSRMLKTRYDEILRGYVKQRINIQGFADEVLHRLFKNKDGIGIDLLATDILRGRDHGFSPYVKYLEFCGYNKINDFDDLGKFIDFKIIEKLKKSYRSVFDIDLMVGALLENTHGELIGPTFKHIILEQLKRLRAGDRYFYDRTDGVYPFTADQLHEIRKYTIGHLLCENSNIEAVPRSAFITPRSDSDFIRCSDLTRLEYSPWRVSRY